MKKIVSFLLALVLTFGMSVAGFAATNPKITKQVSALDDEYAGEVSPGTTIALPLGSNMFENADGKLNADQLTAAEVRAANITVKYTAKSGPKAIESVAIKENSAKKAVVLVTLADPFTSTKPLDFEVSIVLYIGSKRQSHTTTVTGTLTNEEEFVYADTDYIDLSEGIVAVCEEGASKVEAYLGNDVSMFVRMVKGKSYAGSASMEATDADIDVFEQYPDVVDVYRLSVSGLSGTGKTVKITSDSKLYIYDSDLNYLGTTDDMLTFKDVYYAATKKLDVIDTSADDEEEYDDYDDEYVVEDDSDVYPDDVPEGDTLPAVTQTGSGSKNRADNPDTGVSPIFGFSAVAGMVSLAVMGAVSVKKKK